ncbi:MAG TPA: superoxide dismutase family protein [Thermoanaerobaculia bacterium]|nr:superoxide dismutase family protein [Thermoanaerobaculia bacterium]
MRTLTTRRWLAVALPLAIVAVLAVLAVLATVAAAAAMDSAEATLHSQDAKVSGSVHFTQEAAGVHVVADVSGVKPGQHGFHIHEKGDCTAPDYKSAGGHFNPAAAPHACDPTSPRHAGDFGNITVGADGKGHLDMTTTSLSFAGPNSVVGKAVILHEGEDDCKTQPTGNAGGRLACGVVEQQPMMHHH